MPSITTFLNPTPLSIFHFPDNSFMTVCDCHCLMSTWWPDDCLTTHWQLHDNCLTTAWFLNNNCLIRPWLYPWRPDSWQQQQKALEAAHTAERSIKTYLRIILKSFLSRNLHFDFDISLSSHNTSPHSSLRKNLHHWSSYSRFHTFLFELF